jgi:putative heme-binding domain-containing protein
MESCADHLHWAGGAWTDSRGGMGKHSDAGGGHAHVGCMVYLGDNWPDKYRNTVFTCNLHGNRLNNDPLEPKGSGYVAHHGADFMFANDTWFRGITVRYGPDGGVFVSDWNETGECHNHQGIDRTTGRVYKVTYGKPKPFSGDLSKMSDKELVDLQTNKNDWFVQHARRLLAERAATGKLNPSAVSSLQKLLAQDTDVRHQLRAVWALHAVGALDESQRLALMQSSQEYVRAWAIQLSLEERHASQPVLAKLAELAASDPSPVVRLNIASVMQRISVDKRWEIAQGLVGHAEDATDQNLPLMDWYAIEPMVPTDTARALDLLEKTKISLVRQYIVRRPGGDLAPLVQLLTRTSDAAVQTDVLRGMTDALAGQRSVKMPDGWEQAYQNLCRVSTAHQSAAGDAHPTATATSEVRDLATGLALLFGDPAAVESITKIVNDTSADAKARQGALQALVQNRAPGVEMLLRKVIADPVLSATAVHGLGEQADDANSALILEKYPSLPADAKAVAVQVLTTRSASAMALLDAIEKGTVPRTDLSAFTVRQIVGLKDKKLRAKLEKVWGVVRDSSEDKAILAVKYRSILTADELKKANLSAGRAVFTKSCAVCHTLFDAGGNVGPNLTGSQRANLDYVLENVLDPSAVVAKDYEMAIIDTKDGRTLTGTIGGETPNTITVRQPAPAGDVVIPKNEIEKRRTSPISMMPEGLLDQMKPEEVRDLIGYLASPQQVALPPGTPETGGAGK